MGRRKKVEHLVSAGGVVCRWDRQEALEVVLCGRRSPSVWALPKGTPEDGETLEETALREVHEETGLEVQLLEPIGTTEYWFAEGVGGPLYHKKVHFYLMAATGGSMSLHDPEFDEVHWFPEDQALKAMTHQNEAKIVRKALLLLRRAKARV